jgi:hypothetical protein
MSSDVESSIHVTAPIASACFHLLHLTFKSSFNCHSPAFINSSRGPAIQHRPEHTTIGPSAQQSRIMSSAELSNASTQTNSRTQEDCLACKLVGSAAFVGVGLYALQVAHRDGTFSKVRPPGGSLIGGRLAALMGVGENFASFDIFYR